MSQQCYTQALTKEIQGFLVEEGKQCDELFLVSSPELSFSNPPATGPGCSPLHGAGRASSACSQNRSGFGGPSKPMSGSATRRLEARRCEQLSRASKACGGFEHPAGRQSVEAARSPSGRRLQRRLASARLSRRGLACANARCADCIQSKNGAMTPAARLCPNKT